MSRFFKSAAFPILIVIVLAFFASKLISGQDRSNQYKFGDFLEQLDEGQVEQATMRTKDNSLEVILRQPSGTKYQTGYPHFLEPKIVEDLVAAKEANRLTNFDVKPSRSSVILSLLTYVLPFLIFIGF